MTPKPSNAYERILATASAVLSKGIQHVGINEVIANSDVAKRTFYKFPKTSLFWKSCSIEKSNGCSGLRSPLHKEENC